MRKSTSVIILAFVLLLFSYCCAYAYAADSNSVIGFYDENGVAIYSENDNYGLVNRDGIIIAAAEYDSIMVTRGLNTPSSEEYGWYVYEKGQETGCISKTGKTVKHDPEWHCGKYDYFTGSLMVIRNTATKKYNISNTDGKLLFDDWYDNIIALPAGGALIEDGTSIIELDDSGQIIAQIPADGETVIDCSESYVYTRDPVRKKSRLRALPDLSLVIDDCDFIDKSGYQDGLILARRDGKTGFLDELGAIAIPFIYDSGSNSFSCGKAVVNADDCICFINTSGEVLYKIESDSVLTDTHFLSQGIYYLDEARHIWGFMDEYGNILSEVNENRYTQCPDLGNASEFVTVHDEATDMYGIMKYDGTWLLKPEYNAVGVFRGSYTYAEQGSRFGIINRQGEWVCEPQWKSIDLILERDDGVYVIGRKEQDQEEQVFNLKGEWLCPYFWNNSKWN